MSSTAAGGSKIGSRRLSALAWIAALVLVAGTIGPWYTEASAGLFQEEAETETVHGFDEIWGAFTGVAVLVTIVARLIDREPWGGIAEAVTYGAYGGLLVTFRIWDSFAGIMESVEAYHWGFYLVLAGLTVGTLTGAARAWTDFRARQGAQGPA